MAWERNWAEDEGAASRRLRGRRSSPVALGLVMAGVAGIASAGLVWWVSGPDEPPARVASSAPSTAPTPAPVTPAPAPSRKVEEPMSPTPPSTAAARPVPSPVRPAPAPPVPAPQAVVSTEPPQGSTVAIPAPLRVPEPTAVVRAPESTPVPPPPEPTVVARAPEPMPPPSPPAVVVATPSLPTVAVPTERASSSTVETTGTVRDPGSAAGTPGRSAASGGLPTEEAERLTVRAAALVKQGDISGARLLLGRAAASEHAPAVFALAETYDPAMLESWRVRGIRADTDRARTLYEQALAGGVTDARERLERLR